MDGLIGREPEAVHLAGLLDGLGERGGALLVRGEPGIGKSSILAAASAEASDRGFQVLATNGVQSETKLPFAGLHQLLRPIRTEVEGLPPRLRDALLASFGVSAAPAPDPYLIAFATLDLIAEAAHRSPILLVADDVHWLDVPTVDVLSFVSRRLESESILFLGSIREGFESPLMQADLPELKLTPLDAVAAGLLLDAHASDLSPPVRQRVLDEAQGNPLALVELPEALRIERLTNEPMLPGVLPVTARLERAFAHRLGELPPATRILLVVAAVDDQGSIAEVLSAGAMLNEEIIGTEVMSAAVLAGLIELREQEIIFRHPLVRSAIYQSATPDERQAAHAALAEVLIDEPDRRPWHRAASIDRADEEVAADLEAAAMHAIHRGGIAVAIEGLQRAARVGSEAHRAGRLLRAAEAGIELGRRDVVARLFGEVEPLELGPTEQARLAMIREMLDPGVLGDPVRIRAFVAHADAAQAQGDTDLALSLLWLAANRSFWSDPGEQIRTEIIASVDRIVLPDGDVRQLAIYSYVAPIEHGNEVLDALSRPPDAGGDSAAASRLLGTAALILGALDLSAGFLGSAAEALRAEGRLGALPRVLVLQTYVAALLADWKVAIPAAAEAERISAETGEPIWGGGAQAVKGIIAALRGDLDGARSLAAEAEQAAFPVGARFMLGVAQFVRGLSALAEGRDDEAYDHLRRVFVRTDPSFHPFMRLWWVGDLAEAAGRSGHHEPGRAILEELAPLAERSGSAWHRMQIRYARALLADDEEAEELFDEALGGEITRWPFLRARTLLAYGEWLRRQRRVAESRMPLRTARDTFDALGVVPWSERARRELRASGEASPRRAREAWDALTPQELQIARLAAEGSSNREIGQQLYLSHRTVASHLYRIFPKLGITSRSQLLAALSSGAGQLE